MKNPILPILGLEFTAAAPLKTFHRFCVLALILCFFESSFADTPKVQRVAQTQTAPSSSTHAGFSGGIEIFDISKLDRIPELKVRTAAQYPFEMRRAGKTGEVVVEFIVDTNGNVQNAFAVRSSQREFEANAVAAVSKWKFKPGQKGGRIVNTLMQVPIVFTLNEE